MIGQGNVGLINLRFSNKWNVQFMIIFLSILSEVELLGQVQPGCVTCHMLLLTTEAKNSASLYLSSYHYHSYLQATEL